ncbi:hypothetical protein [Spirosoma radiotolerans]|uniref:Uncharacterized protein n=1 Tax=Spirosoma radiotolerans TaxID=1379870 RepID=A0A0E3V6I1_9BACT|nr:hypothetical protein [Spirosoma radiotolerans]AKD55042.1 hypothetical protein SD10_09125 [Spirosoma radiotolerans]
MENTAILQLGLLVATGSFLATCFTTHAASKAYNGILYALTFSTFLSLVCVRYVPYVQWQTNSLGLTFILLSISGGFEAYADFVKPETNRVKTGTRLAYLFGAILLFTLIIWSFDNYRSQKAEKVIEKVSTKMDTIAVGQKQNKAKISKIETKLDTLAKSDTMLAKTVEATKSELWQKSDQGASEIRDGLSTLSLQQHRMNTNLQKQKQKAP